MRDFLIGIGAAAISICIIGWIISPFILFYISNTLSDISKSLSYISKSLKELVEIECKKSNRK